MSEHQFHDQLTSASSPVEYVPQQYEYTMASSFKRIDSGACNTRLRR